MLLLLLWWQLQLQLQLWWLWRLCLWLCLRLPLRLNLRLRLRGNPMLHVRPPCALCGGLLRLMAAQLHQLVQRPPRVAARLQRLLRRRRRHRRHGRRLGGGLPTRGYRRPNGRTGCDLGCRPRRCNSCGLGEGLRSQQGLRDVADKSHPSSRIVPRRLAGARVVPVLLAAAGVFVWAGPLGSESSNHPLQLIHQVVGSRQGVGRGPLVQPRPDDELR
mmetsp:Transcript_7340/g.18389  ORF Transcript_7340/g.18389 Transcript_7340/m.18389 type:complete len:217 (+) Transcript_7340:86-736(+)